MERALEATRGTVTRGATACILTEFGEASLARRSFESVGGAWLVLTVAHAEVGLVRHPRSKYVDITPIFDNTH